MTITIQTTSQEETMKIGELLAKDAFSNSTIILSGDLGAGKTTFTKGFALGLDITRVIKSPTYTLIREYTKGRLPLFHMDMYRIEESGGASEIGLEEYFHREGVVMVEWANFIEEELPMNRLIISIEQTSLTTRSITLDAIGEEYEKWLNQFESWWTNERESELEIEVVSAEDAEALIEYTKKVGKETDFLSFGEEGLELTIQQEELYIQSVLESDNQMMLLAKLGQEIIAVASIGGNSKEKFQHVGELGISILKEYWGQGLGSALMEELLSWAKDYSPLEKIKLAVVQENDAAIALYKKFGFEVVAIEEKEMKVNGQYYDVIQMAYFVEKE